MGDAMSERESGSTRLKGFTFGGLYLLAVCALSAGCAGTTNPVLYPNNHLQQVGQAEASRDIAECRQLASSSGVAETKDGQVARQATGGAAVGGASAAAWGLVRGNDAGERALAGAAAGAAAGTVRGSMKSSETSPVYKNFVQKCLRDRGYEVIGWQ
jgi:outer membrane lipoprotein SlyB